MTYGSSNALGDQRVYLLVEGRTALGFLKVGQKRLFVASSGRAAFADVQGAFRELEPLCVLDFYVHERCQRAGHGRRLFDTMLSRERVDPARLAYDRPSPKLLGFLRKHFGLTKFQPQSNNFVVFDAYFDPGIEDRVSEDLSFDGQCAGRRSGPSLSIGGSSSASLEARRRQATGISSGRDIASELRPPHRDLFDREPVHRRAAAAPMF